ncbi:transforming growth factor beta regulator 1 [Copidosoma floridanum]|uniref:transforming growth factor beta regulator 1 n=1 Tax=Copidosoma floridanum TaxID=29053 RepID=UPI0006C97DC4|nr:transforming growth factor beta regulator 1 [Copidosoma floridanum]
MSNSYGTTYYSEAYNNREHQQNLKYKNKLKKLKKLIKDIVVENSALCDEVSRMQENLVVVKEERLMLLRRLCQLQGEVDLGTLCAKSQMGSSSSPVANSDTHTPKKSAKKRSSVETPDTKSKPKRSSKISKKVVQLIPLDVNGRPIFPISLGDLTVYSLGDVVTDRIAYHTEDLIFPVGYCSTRVYASLKDVRMKSLYTCKILDGGMKPRFEIVSDTDLDQPLVGSSPDECHLRLLATISPSLSSVFPKGADFFGISHPTIQNLIQSSPGTRKLINYKPQKFEISKSSDITETNPAGEEDPSLGFAALHRHYALPSAFVIKQEPSNHGLISFQELLS